MSKQRLHKTYQILLIILGALVCFFSLYRLFFHPDNLHPFDISFFLLALITVVAASRVSVQIPSTNGYVTVSDTLIFLTILLYGGEAAVFIAVAEGLSSSSSFRGKTSKLTTLMNAGSMACSIFATIWSIRVVFGSIPALSSGSYTPKFVSALLVMAFVHYVVNSVLIAIHSALKNDKPIIETWAKYYLWASITYLAGAFAAGIAAKIVIAYHFYAINALILAAPIILIIYLTYRTYLKNVEASAAAAKAQEAQRFYEERESIREQYAQVEKLSALGELASGVAHNFNNTLAGILGRAQMLQQSNNLEEIRRGLGIIVKVAEDGAQTVKRIQDFARQRRDHDFAPLAVDQLLLDTSEITRPRWKNHAEARNVHINLELEIASKATVMGDASELREVLVNLVFNAVDAMPDGGKLRLSTKDVGGVAQILVSDTGIGMSEETKSRIFDPFFTTKGKAGLGLGLAVSYGIIRRHEGIFEVESELGQGTTFSIKLPIANTIALPQHPPKQFLPTTSSGSHELANILIVDDEEYVRELLRDVLQGEGFRVVLAADGNEALRLHSEKKIAGVFTDVGLPGINGWEVARALRERDPTIPIAVITGWGDSVGSDEQRAAGVEWVVTKPFSVERITQIAQIIAESRQVIRNTQSPTLVDRTDKNFGLVN